MTDTTPLAIDWDAVTQRFQQWEAGAATLIAGNKTKLLSFLSAAGITRVMVNFDGCGDSGQIEDVAAFKGDHQVDLPPETVELLVLDYGATEPVTHVLPVGEAVEKLAYDLLHQKHSGWENNDGAFGEFTFDIAAGTITLDYNERFTSSENYMYQW